MQSKGKQPAEEGFVQVSFDSADCISYQELLRYRYTYNRKLLEEILSPSKANTASQGETKVEFWMESATSLKAARMQIESHLQDVQSEVSRLESDLEHLRLTLQTERQRWSTLQ